MPLSALSLPITISNREFEPLTIGTLGTKKSVTESWTGVAMQLALLLQEGSCTVPPTLAGGGEDQVTDTILCSWTIHCYWGLLRTRSPNG